MKFLSAAGLLLASTSLASPIISNQQPISEDQFKWPTARESAVLARRLLLKNTVAPLNTVWPEGSKSSNSPLGIPEYFANCASKPGSPIVLAMDIGTTYRNIAAGSKLSIPLYWVPPQIGAWDASLPRFSLEGTLVNLTKSEIEDGNIKDCFIAAHSDSKWWLPGSPPMPGPSHRTYWTKLEVTGLYWIGGFGDTNYIGWISADDWYDVTDEEIANARLRKEI